MAPGGRVPSGNSEREYFDLWEQQVEVNGSTHGSMRLHLIGPANLNSITFWHLNHGRRDQDTYWARPWASALALAALIAAEPDMVRSKEVIELGAGVGAPGIVAKLCGATSVLLTDREELGLQCAKLSADKSEALNIQTTILDFTQPVPPHLHQKFDLVLASDVLHERQLCDPLALAVASLVRPGGSLYLAERTDRYPANLKRFQDLLGTSMRLKSIRNEKIKLPKFTNEMLDFDLDDGPVDTTFLRFNSL